MPKPIYVNGKKELMEIITKNYDNMIVFMFTAKWCGPCKKMKNVLEGEWYKKNPTKTIIYIDIDDIENEDIICDFDIEVVPTFVINRIHNGKLVKLNTFNGANMEILEEMINK